MLFSEILGLDHLKAHLTASADRGRIPHAQLFVGSHGSGTLPMALAYAQYLLCQNTDGENNSGNSACNLKFEKFSHPDLHFAFPVAISKKVKSKPVAANYLEEWRLFLKNQPYGTLFDWLKDLGIENKQGLISIKEAEAIVKSLSLKAYEGGLKVMLIWCADKMNREASNKLLKLIEEPPENTVFLLITENEGQLLQTIRSRCQALHFPPLGEADIAKALEQIKGCSGIEAKKIAHLANGNYTKALQILDKDESEDQFEKWFIAWVRTAFRAKGNKAAIRKLLAWSEEIAGTGRETQKKFLDYCGEFFRQALMANYGAQPLVFLSPTTEGFELDNFAPFVHGNNAKDLFQEIEKASYHIERNGNAKIILSDLSIKLTRLLHQKP